ncbi:MAG TPA: hypothetical protein GYA10_04675 [Alphaproteobacteria bacterium]|nr:hypothetical protein [Alphaproteobacteria bacterium]
MPSPVAWLGALAVILVAATLVWFAGPAGIEARHHFVSPSGRIVLDLGETCAEAGCTRVLVKEESAPDGRRLRQGCPVPLTEPRPMLRNAYPLWSDDERAVDLVYADADGVGGKFTIDLARDCTGAA